MNLLQACPLREASRNAHSRIAIASSGKCYTFAELDFLADMLANALKTQRIEPGDRIAVQHPPCAELIALFFAAWRTGASICPLSRYIPPLQRESHLIRLDAKLFVDSFPFSHPLRLARHPPSPLSLLLFTSGTTASPKIAVLSLPSLLSNASSALQALDLKPQDRWLLNLPLYHVGGIGIFLRCILAHATIVFNDTDPLITHSSAVPTQLYRMTPLYRNLRRLLIGGASLASYPDQLPCVFTYGLTEMGSLVTAQLRPRNIGSHFPTGFPLHGREIHLRENREICVRGSTLFLGYWENGKISHPCDPDGWFATGDLGEMTPDGLIILGRKDRQFISGGENIQPEEIERELALIPEVLQAAVVPLPDPEYGARPAACLQCSDPTFDLMRMQRALAPKLPKFKIPCRLRLLDEWPKAGTKTDYKKILETASQRI